jgi:hypothetical protein
MLRNDFHKVSPIIPLNETRKIGVIRILPAYILLDIYKRLQQSTLFTYTFKTDYSIDHVIKTELMLL